MDARGQHTLAEILSQPEIWADALEVIEARTADLAQFWQAGDFDRVIFTGCGSTYYLSQFAASLLQTRSGRPARAYPASELVLFPDSYFDLNANTLLVAVSRSGETTETIGAARLFRQRYPGKTLVVTNYSESALAREADFVLAVDSGREVSVAQTRSFSSMALVTQAIAAIFSGQAADFAALPGVAKRVLTEYEPLARKLGEDPAIQRFFFLGSNALYAIACEAMLKMKEMSLSYSEAYHMLEFRHGPMSMTNEQTLVVGLLSDQAYGHEVAVLRDMAARGARVLALGEEPGADAAGLGDVVALRSGLPFHARAIAYLPFLQLMAYYRAMFNQQNPDVPGNLHAVIVLDPLV